MGRVVQVWAENLPEQRFLEAILRAWVEAGTIAIDSGLGGTSILSIGSSILLRDPSQPIALVFNTGEDDPVEMRIHVASYMRRYAARDAAWHAALAIPRVDDWVTADPRLARLFESEPHFRNDRYNRASHIERLTRDEPFDVEALRRKDAEFRGLIEFLDRHARPIAAARREKVRRP